jgi:hypothetical protein
MIENAAHALDNGKAEAETRRAAVMLETLELLEDHVALVLGYSEAAVVNLDDQLVSAPAAAEHGAALLLVIFERIRNKVLQNPPQELSVGTDEDRMDRNLLSTRGIGLRDFCRSRRI